MKDMRSYVKSLSVSELKELEKLIRTELTSRDRVPQKCHHVVTYSDGASRGNPGHAGIGVLITDGAGEKILQDYQYVGTTTNNEAEYRALILALDHALEITQGDIECILDSELVVKQMRGEYALKSEKLMHFNQEVRTRVGRFKSVKFTHVPREHPQLRIVDSLANRAIDEALKEQVD